MTTFLRPWKGHTLAVTRLSSLPAAQAGINRLPTQTDLSTDGGMRK